MGSDNAGVVPILKVLIVGHSFVRRLANYALSIGEMNMRLNKGDCAVSFIGRGGMTVPKLCPAARTSCSLKLGRTTLVAGTICV